MRRWGAIVALAVVLAASVLLLVNVQAPEPEKPQIPEVPKVTDLPFGPETPEEPKPPEEPEPPEPEVLPVEGAVVIEGVSAGIWECEGERFLRCSDLTGVLDSEFIAANSLTLGGEDLLPLEAVDLLGGARLFDEERSTLYITPSSAEGEIDPGVNVPIFMYHALEEEPWGIPELFVRPGDFEEQLQYLTDNGYDPIWFTDLPHLGNFDKPVILTFDDGYEDNYTVLLPLLQKYGVKATVFVIASLVGTEQYMTAEQVREMADSGLVSIQSHTWSHRYLDELPEEELRVEMERSRLELARMTGRVPVAVCYPSGRSSRLVRETAAEYYQYGVRAKGNMYSTDEGRYNMDRYGFARDDTFKYFTRSVGGAGR